MVRSTPRPVPLRQIVEHGEILHARCQQPGCLRIAPLDVAALVERFGLDAPLRPTIVEHLVCSSCGSREIALLLLPGSKQYRPHGHDGGESVT